MRLEGDGRIGVFAFAPVFDRDLPRRTPGERRDALRGVVVAMLSTETLVHEAVGAGVAVTDGPTVLAAGGGGNGGAPPPPRLAGAPGA